MANKCFIIRAHMDMGRTAEKKMCGASPKVVADRASKELRKRFPHSCIYGVEVYTLDGKFLTKVGQRGCFRRIKRRAH